MKDGKMIGGTRIAVMAMIAASLATAADAQPRRYGGWGHRGGYGHYHRGGGDGVLGAIVGGLVVGGLIAAVSGAGDRDGDGKRPDSAPRPGEDAAVDQCAAGVERETAGTVDQIDTVDRFADGWRVVGTVETGRQDAGHGDAEHATTGAYRGRDSFSCSIVNGRIDDVRFGSDAERATEPSPAR